MGQLNRSLTKKFTFIDLFAGIGGMRIAFEEAGASCVFSSEWDKYASLTYEKKFGEKPEGDIRAIPSERIPSHNILVAGFPCQPFSISGVSKKQALGRPHGFDDITQGTLFFEIVRILRHHRPDAFLLENVKNLKSHDRGRTFAVIMEQLVDDLGYDVSYKVLDAARYVPQHRERIFIAGFRERSDFKFPVYEPEEEPTLRDILEKDKRVGEQYTLTDHLWRYLQQYAEKHRLKGNGFGYQVAPLHGRTRTLSARYYKDGSEILIKSKEKNPRRLTPRECARLMGFDDSFPISQVSDTQAYKQFGNSIVVPLVRDIAKAILGSLQKTSLFKKSALKNLSFVEGDRYQPGLFPFPGRKQHA